MFVHFPAGLSYLNTKVKKQNKTKKNTSPNLLHFPHIMFCFSSTSLGFYIQIINKFFKNIFQKFIDLCTQHWRIFKYI